MPRKGTTEQGSDTEHIDPDDQVLLNNTDRDEENNLVSSDANERIIANHDSDKNARLIAQAGENDDFEYEKEFEDSKEKDQEYANTKHSKSRKNLGKLDKNNNNRQASRKL